MVVKGKAKEKGKERETPVPLLAGSTLADLSMAFLPLLCPKSMKKGT